MDTGTLPAGRLLKNGTYRIEKVLGQGGFGITYLALHIALEKQVVVKEFFMRGYSIRKVDDTVGVQSLPLADYSKYKDKFLEEARLLAKFEHNPCIVDVTDHFEENNTAYFVMTYIKGSNLTQYAQNKGGKISEQDAIRVVKELAVALREMHSKSVLHRDLKPDNILIGENGKIFLVDFGAAREFISQEATQHSVLLTPGYAPIEQYDNVAERGSFTDIYSLGATLYKVLTGLVPVAAPARNIQGILPPRELNPQISEATNQAVMKAMALRPQERFQSIDAFLMALEQKKGASTTYPENTQVFSETMIVQPKTEIVKNPKKQAEVEQKAAQLIKTANGYFSQKNYKKALDEYEKASQLLPHNLVLKNRIVECEGYLDTKGLSLGKKIIIAICVIAIITGAIIGFNSHWFSWEKEELAIPDMAYIKGGKFSMGGIRSLEADRDEFPAHQVKLSSFYIAKKEITVRQYKVFCKEKNRSLPAVPPWGWNDDFPMSNINRDDAIVYCKWLSEKTKHKYRLPTEAEWEYVARGGANGITFKFSGGNNKNSVSWNVENSGDAPHKVGRRDANNLGVYDMTGNVWEWCSDTYSPIYYKSSIIDNPQGAAPNPKSNLGVLRGGSFKSYQKDLRVTNRQEFMPTGSAKDFGFRVVRD